MKKLFVFVNKLGIKQLLLGCLFAGVFFGTLCSNLLKEYYMGQLFLFDESYLNRIVNMDMDCLAISAIALIDYIKEFGLLLLLATTVFGMPYMLLHCTYKGFFLGFLVSTAVLRYGVKGILFVLCYLLPQCLIYVPVLVLTYLRIYKVNSGLFAYVDKTELRISKYLPSMLGLLLLLAIASVLEGYLNTSLLRMIMLKLM